MRFIGSLDQGESDFIESIDAECIHYEGWRVSTNENLIAEIVARGLRATTRDTGLDRKTKWLSTATLAAVTCASATRGLRALSSPPPFASAGMMAGHKHMLSSPMQLRCKTEAGQERLEPGVIANGVEARIHFEENEPVVALLISLFEPFERLIVCAQTDIEFTDYVG